MEELPLDQLFAAGTAGLICATALIALVLVLRHLKEKDDAD